MLSPGCMRGGCDKSDDGCAYGAVYIDSSTGKEADTCAPTPLPQQAQRRCVGAGIETCSHGSTASLETRQFSELALLCRL